MQMSPGSGLMLFIANTELHEVISEYLSIVFLQPVGRMSIIMYHIT